MRCTLLLVGALASCGKGDSTKANPPPQTPSPVGSESQPAAPTPPPAPPAADAGCRLNSPPHAPIRRAGTATLKITGDGLAIDVADAKAVCGAAVTMDAKVGNQTFKKGDGVVFEACTPDGLLAVISDVTRTPGVQKLGAEGVKVVFNRADGASYLASDAGDAKIEFAPDFFAGTAKLTLKKMGSADTITVDAAFRCPN